ncbi:YIP1 family protein, partial [Candidatus Woesearchaeota archaeon]|nr:YIP1 family protein [Candidatus Woesearchaeota archaeon]
IYNVCFRPTKFFQTVEKESFLTTLLFYLILTGIVAIITFPATYLQFQQSPSELLNIVPYTAYSGLMAAIALGMYVAGIAGLLITAFILHLAVKVMKGKANYVQSVRVFVYSSVPALVIGIILEYFALMPLLFVISVIPAIFLFIYQIILSVIGIRDLHKVSTGRSIATLFVFILFVILLAVIIIVIYFIIFALLINTGIFPAY